MHQPCSVTVSCTSLSSTILLKAQHLAKKLQFDFSPFEQAQSDYILNVSDTRIELYLNPLRGGGKTTPLYVDFVGGKSGFRHARNHTTKQPIARAVGIKPGFRPRIVDCTAGLGADGFVFSSLGCQVHLCERSPVIGTLLEDGICRALKSGGPAAEAAGRLSLSIGDAATLLRQGTIVSPYTIYLDPMYPKSGKSALNRKEMRFLRDLVGDNEDAGKLLSLALEKAENRCVVKRPRGAEFLSGRKPTHQITMKNSRFDVYLCSHL